MIVNDHWVVATSGGQANRAAGPTTAHQVGADTPGREPSTTHDPQKAPPHHIDVSMNQAANVATARFAFPLPHLGKSLLASEISMAKCRRCRNHVSSFQSSMSWVGPPLA